MPSTTPLLLILFGTALVVSSIGFVRLVWFISIGYGYAIAAMALALGVIAGPEAEWLLLAATGCYWLNLLCFASTAYGSERIAW
jgi:hypothetical protein